MSSRSSSTANISKMTYGDEYRQALVALSRNEKGGRGKWFPPVAWTALLRMLRNKRPEVAENLEALWERVNTEDQYDPAPDLQRISMQGDAIGLSLDIAGLSDLGKKEFKKIYTTVQAREVNSFVDLMDVQSRKRGP